MKHTKSIALLMAVVMMMSITTLSASAATNNPWQAQATYDTKEEAIKSAIYAVVGMDGDIIDWETYTVTRTWTGETCIWVFDPDTFVWTITNTVTGEISTSQAQKPKYWYVDDILIDTATGLPANGDAGNGHSYDNGVIIDQTNPEPVQSEKPVESEKQYFPDVTPNAWYYNAVNTMAANGIINGYDDGLFHPEDNVTVGELCAIIYRLAQNDNPVGKPVPDHPEYTHWASYAVWTLNNAAKFYTSCRPTYAQDIANRGEAVKAIMALLEDAKLIDNLGWSSKYTRVFNYTADDNDIPDWDIIATFGTMPHVWSDDRILYAYNYGIVHGVDSTGRFDPTGSLTRAELCQMLANADLTDCLNITITKPALGYVLGG